MDDFKLEAESEVIEAKGFQALREENAKAEEEFTYSLPTREEALKDFEGDEVLSVTEIEGQSGVELRVEWVSKAGKVVSFVQVRG